jgi:hypothetical protein
LGLACGLATATCGYLGLCDWWTKRTDRCIDAAACDLGLAYARGGVEFYDQVPISGISVSAGNFAD